MADDLLPCPFCGGIAEHLDIEGADGDPNAGGSCIECTQCGACSALHFDRKENLVASWNDRVASREADVWDAIIDKACRYAEHYERGTDGRNTFILFAKWACGQAVLSEASP